MAGIEPKQREIAIVLVGRFNPAIVQPGWLAKYGVVGESEAKAAKVQFINPDLTILRFDLFEVIVQSENFTIKTHDAHPEIIRDFVLKTFGEFLSHTPIRMLGINYQVVLECPLWRQEIDLAGGWRLTSRGENGVRCLKVIRILNLPNTAASSRSL